MTESRTAELVRGLTRTPSYRELVPIETAPGLPLPMRRDGESYVVVPVYGVVPDASSGGQAKAVKAPLATFTVAWANLRTVGYRSLSVDRLWPASDDGVVGTMTVDWQRDVGPIRERLYGMYDTLLQVLATAESLPDEWVTEFGSLFARSMEPGLAPYYKRIAPQFHARFVATAPSG